MKVRNLFKTKVFWSFVLTIVAAGAPLLEAYIDRGGLSGQEVKDFILVVCASAYSLIGLMDADDGVYTPPWLPGRSKMDVPSVYTSYVPTITHPETMSLPPVDSTEHEQL